MFITAFKNFSKRINSTKRPVDSTGTSIDVSLKAGTSIENPVFLLSGTDLSYNYIKAFNHYYFIVDCEVVDNNMVAYTCSHDVLATYKDDIGNYTAFVERSSSDFDSYVKDNLISASQKVVSSARSTTSISDYSETGNYVLRLQGKNGIDQYIGTRGGINSILYKAYDIENFTDFYSGINIDTVTEGMDQLQQLLFTWGYDPSKFIVSLMWFPFNFGIEGSSPDCYMGFYDLGAITGAGKTTMTWTVKSGSISLPSAYYGDFRDYDPSWSRYTIYIPGIGETTLDAASLSKGLRYTMSVDVVTGVNTVVLTDSSGAHITTLVGNIGVSQQLGFASAQSATLQAVGSQLSNLFG